MASQTQGIQQLLAAEKRAAEKVSEARKRKNQLLEYGKNRRLKQAKEEAHAEIEAYRAERERQYREHEAKILGSKGDTEAKINQATRIKIEEQNKSVNRNNEAAMKRLLDLVCDIRPEIHKNYNPKLGH